MKSRLSLLLIVGCMLVLAVPELHAAPPPTPSSAQTQSPAPEQFSSRQWQRWVARMRLMREQMNRIHRTTRPKERARLLREHMHTMLEQMRAMRAMGGPMMSGTMNEGMARRGRMGGRAMGERVMGGGMMGRGVRGGNRMGRPYAQRQWMQDRLDMMQMMMEQMMDQIQAMQPRDGGMRRPHK